MLHEPSGSGGSPRNIGSCFKMTYSQLLQHPKWQKKRLVIFNRDNFQCRKCSDTETNLQVHHLYYNDCLPWEYPDEALLTLCDLCHKKEEFKKWVFRYGYQLLLTQGFIKTDIREISDLVCRRVDSNMHRESALRYMEDIRKLMSDYV